MTTATKRPEETKAAARLRALGQGIQVFVLEPGYRYCVPSARGGGDGKAYQVIVEEGAPNCNCQAGQNDRYCKHVAAVEMRIEAEADLLLASVQTVNDAPVDDDELEAKIADLYR